MSHSNLCHIVGAGAIGQYFAHELSPIFPVCLHARQNTIQTIELQDTQNTQQRVSLFDDNMQSISLLIICTKAFAALDAFKQYQSRLHANSIVICLFNGLGPQFDIQNIHKNTWLASTTVGVRKLNSNTIKHTGQGETTIGQILNNQTRDLTFTSNNEPTDPNLIIQKLNWTHSNSILETLYLKLAVNSLINPLTVIYNCKNGALLNHPEAIDLMQQLAKEIQSLCQIKKINLTAHEIFETSCQIARKTAENFSSMQQDIQNKRRSEIDLINGYWLEIGKQNHLPTPLNFNLVKQIKTLSNYEH